ncbi:CAP domain-containing protein [Streptomyces antarcticus]|uniref:CAP domain-containing protein n=1 Tax=Streptomyces antarcticus TaxID=2996458 RepID=UPI00226D8AE5|nr:MULTISPECIES: CAP domain-containing protein [unclassified Streptomyces]MCY0943830.1 CAP domain-containing protein [Streptomyces sp. H34-AA3]MCZ4085712.1 CAP domain-containing protein [Streptomyces sp. H34-S5]
MKKHRKTAHHRKMLIAVGALTVVGVPSAAMACLDTQDTGPIRATAAQRDTNPWQDNPFGSPTPQPPSEAPAQDGAPADPGAEPAAPAEPAAQPVAEPPAAPAAEPAPAASRPAEPAQPVKPVKPVKPTKPAQPTKQATKPAAPKDTGAPSGAQAEVLALVNKERAAVGCPVLTLNAKLTKAAQDHSTDMAANSNMSHTGSDGSDPGRRITRAGYEWRTYGENVAYGYSTPEKVMEGWMNSPGHKRNILDCSYKEIGIGLAQPGHYWTQDFGAAR